MDLFKVEPLDRAGTLLREAFPELHPGVERVPLLSASGRILAQDLFAGAPVPHFHRSVVDGYAVAAADTFGAGESAPVFLSLKEAVEMGQGSLTALIPGTACYVPTGGALPAGADAVVMVEYAEPFGPDSVALYKSAAPWENTLRMGEDLPAEELLALKGCQLRPQEVGMLAAVGITEVPVVRCPLVTLLSTGDELVDPAETPGPGQVRDINTYTLSALAEAAGCAVVRRKVLTDDFEILREALAEALADSDLVLVSGGSSVGVKDHTLAVMESFPDSRILAHGLAVKPGKPTILAKVLDKPVIGLPGQPASAMMIFKAVVEPFLRHMTGRLEAWDSEVTATLSVNLPSAPGRTTFQMVRLEPSENGLRAVPVYGKSGMISLMGRAHGYIRIDARREGLPQGEAVTVRLF